MPGQAKDALGAQLVSAQEACALARREQDALKTHADAHRVRRDFASGPECGRALPGLYAARTGYQASIIFKKPEEKR